MHGMSISLQADGYQPVLAMASNILAMTNSF